MPSRQNSNSDDLRRPSGRNEISPTDLLSLIGLLGGASNQPVHVAEVVRHGEKIVLPKGMSTQQAIQNLERQLRYDNETVKMNFEFPYFVWDGAFALAKVMQDRYGFVFGEDSENFFGTEPPQLIGIETSLGTVEQVPWGKFSVPSIKGGEFECGYAMKDGKLLFKFSATCKHMYEDEVKSLRDAVEQFLKTNSIYKGKAFSIRFTDDDGDPLLESKQIPTPRFLDVARDREHELVFPRDVEDQIRTNLFTVLERIEEVRASGIPVKRGILLAGNFGVGKTLTAYVAAHKAVTSGITYIYCEKPEEFTDVMRLAVQYAPALVFCEDVDRIVPSERDKDVDQLINIIDGVETKNSEIVTVFTTNAVVNVNKALLRPGRMDAVIVVREADAEAVQRLIRNYAGEYLEPNVDLTEIGILLAGNIPAVIREVCERSKLAAMRMTPKGRKLKTIPIAALEEAAVTMRQQLDLLNKRDEPQKEPLVQVADSIREVAVAMNGKTTPLIPTSVGTVTGAKNGKAKVPVTANARA